MTTEAGMTTDAARLQGQEREPIPVGPHRAPPALLAPAAPPYLLLLPLLALRPIERSLWARLFWLLARAPLLPASLRLMAPLLAWPRLPRLLALPLLLVPPGEEDFEDAIACSLWCGRPHRAAGRGFTVGGVPLAYVGCRASAL
jgi:hypothetical protein